MFQPDRVGAGVQGKNTGGRPATRVRGRFTILDGLGAPLDESTGDPKICSPCAFLFIEKVDLILARLRNVDSVFGEKWSLRAFGNIRFLLFQLARDVAAFKTGGLANYGAGSGMIENRLQMNPVGL